MSGCASAECDETYAKCNTSEEGGRSYRVEWMECKNDMHVCTQTHKSQSKV